MKDQERRLLKEFNERCDAELKEVPFQYSRFDAYDSHHIVEFKYRKDDYKRTLIEFDKYAYNSAYALLKKKRFLYVVGYGDRMSIFDITDLNSYGYNYYWNWKQMPEQTEFNKTEKIYKFVGSINFNMAINKEKEYEQSV